MIRVRYSPNAPGLTITGHALYAPKGGDIVCAAASILAYTLIKGGGTAEELGNGLRITGGEKEREAFRLIAGGYELLAEGYPENIEFEVKK